MIAAQVVAILLDRYAKLRVLSGFSLVHAQYRADSVKWLLLRCSVIHVFLLPESKVKREGDKWKMLVPEVIKHAVAGNLHFNFIETTITARNQGNLSSLKGRGHARPEEDHFQYKFIPRGPMLKEWTGPDGFLQQDATKSGVEFSIKGTERDSAHWSATADSLRLARSSSGMVVRGNVREWCSFDSRAVSASFMRAIVPGQYLYPVKSQLIAGTRARHASVNVDDMRVEFRDYGHYTEIFAQDSGELPRGLADKAVEALAGVLKRPVELVYKEEHFNEQRHVCVRQANPQLPVQAEGGESTKVDNYGAFWNRYSVELSRLCETSDDTDCA